MRDASGLFFYLYGKGLFGGTSDGIAGDGGTKGAKVLFTFLLFYLFTF